MSVEVCYTAAGQNDHQATLTMRDGSEIVVFRTPASMYGTVTAAIANGERSIVVELAGTHKTIETIDPNDVVGIA